MTTAGYPLSGTVLCATLMLLTGCGGSTDDGTAVPASTSPASSASGGSPSIPPTDPSTPLGPDDMPKPDPEQAAATLRYLAGQGAPVLQVHKIAQAWRPAATRAECERLGGQLDKIGTPDKLIPMIAGVEDEPLQDLLNAETQTLGATVTDCSAGRSPTPQAGMMPLADLSKLIDQRLTQLRAAR